MELAYKNYQHLVKFLRIGTLTFCLLSAGSIAADTDASIQTEFRTWAKRSLHPFTSTATGPQKAEFRALRPLVGNAKIVAFSEVDHSAAEVLTFRNRFFQYLVENLGFDAISIESGIVESRVVNDYVLEGKGDFDAVLKQGISWTEDAFRQNSELVSWIREHNAHLPRGARKVQFYGHDVSGSPGNTYALRGLNTSLVAALEYLQAVDSVEATRFQDRLSKFVPRLTRSGYGSMTQTERDALTAAIVDLISVIEHRRFQYMSRSSNTDYEWGLRSAIGARQVDGWLRTMPVNWKDSDGYEWQGEATQIRARSMADNLNWIVDQLGPDSRMMVFGAVFHLSAAAKRYSNAPNQAVISFGQYAKARYGKDWVSIMNMIGGGKNANCIARNHPTTDYKPPAAYSIEYLFGSLDSPQYVLDLRAAPPHVAAWLRETRTHWGFGFNDMLLPTAIAFDAAYYVRSVSPACREEYR